jgi:hypothetical protein
MSRGPKPPLYITIDTQAVADHIAAGFKTADKTETQVEEQEFVG